MTFYCDPFKNHSCYFYDDQQYDLCFYCDENLSDGDVLQFERIPYGGLISYEKMKIDKYCCAWKLNAYYDCVLYCYLS